MERRIWDSAKKFEVVLEGLKSGASVSEICNRYQISQTQYYKWRDQFLSNGKRVFEIPSKNKEEERLKGEIRKLKTIIGDLTTELKKMITSKKEKIRESKNVESRGTKTDTRNKKRASFVEFPTSVEVFKISEKGSHQQEADIQDFERGKTVGQPDKEIKSGPQKLPEKN